MKCLSFRNVKIKINNEKKYAIDLQNNTLKSVLFNDSSYFLRIVYIRVCTGDLNHLKTNIDG